MHARKKIHSEERATRKRSNEYVDEKKMHVNMILSMACSSRNPRDHFLSNGDCDLFGEQQCRPGTGSAAQKELWPQFEASELSALAQIYSGPSVPSIEQQTVD